MARSFSNLPPEYLDAHEEELSGRIRDIKTRLGKRLLILAHHYQRPEIVNVADQVGDSFALALAASRSRDAEFIVFCGVRFMAEAARVLCGDEQKVFLPNPLAGCPMADMASLDDVRNAWSLVGSLMPGKRLAPISYMNSSSELKAFTGIHDGTICTSSNAGAAFEWGLERFDSIFFFPDKHLGANTANRLGIIRDQVVLFDPSWPDDGIERVGHLNARIILWYGFCYVHTRFTRRHVEFWRSNEPTVKIVVHPECREEVVESADAVGSTSFIVRYLQEAPPGSVIAVGTEIDLVQRLAVANPDKKIFSLSNDTCPLCLNMYRTTLANVCYTLENLETCGQVIVPEEIRADARIALERMLTISS